MRILGMCLLQGGRLLVGGVLLGSLVVAAWSVVSGLDGLREGTLTERDVVAHFAFYPLGAAGVAALGTLFGAQLGYLGERLLAHQAAESEEKVHAPTRDRGQRRAGPGRERRAARRHAGGGPRGRRTGRGRLPDREWRTRSFGEVAFTVLSAVVALSVKAELIATFSGVVREHCLDVEASQQSGMVNIDSHWTYILWPPLMFAANDPPGRCVRNNPTRVALDELGIWSLPSPEAQVRRHIAAPSPRAHAGDGAEQKP